MRISSALVAVIVLSACGGKAKGTAGGAAASGAAEASEGGRGAAVVARPAPVGFAEADAVSFVGGELVAWSFAGGKVAELGRVTLATFDEEDPMAWVDGDWADREHFFAHVPPRTVLHVSASGITPVDVPPESAFAAPRPEVDDEEGLTAAGVVEGEDTGLVVTDGEAWWSECPWGFPYDGWQCEVYVSARLWPDAATRGDRIVGRRWSWAGAKVSGFRTKELDEGRALGCTPTAGTAYKQTQLRGKDEDGEMVHTAAWVSASPPRLLVVWGSPGFADLVPTRWALHDGCNEKPLVEGETVEPGPAGLWIGDGTVYKGGDALGPITGRVKLRPI